MTDPAARPRLSTSALVLVAVLLGGGLVLLAVGPLELFDLRAPLYAAGQWLHGADPYASSIQSPTSANFPGAGFVYPPYFLPLFAAMQLMNNGLSVVLWQLTQLFALAYLLWTLAEPRSPRRLASITILAVLFYPVITNLVIGQAGLAMTALLWAAVRLRSRHDRIGALLLGLASLLKLFPFLLLASFVRRRRWVAAVVAPGTLLAAFAITLPWVGPLWPEYVGRVLLNKVTSPTGLPDAQSILAAVERTFSQNPIAAHLLGLGLSAGMMGVLLVTAWRVDRGDSSLGWAMILAALPLTLPYSWQHYYVLALPLLWMVGSAGLEQRDALLIAAACVSYLCLSPLAMTIDYWALAISTWAGPAAGLYLNGSVLGASVLLLAAARVLIKARQVAVAAEPVPAAAA